MLLLSLTLEGNSSVVYQFFLNHLILEDMLEQWPNNTCFYEVTLRSTRELVSQQNRLCSRPTGTGFSVVMLRLAPQKISVVISGKHGKNILTLGVSQITHDKGL